MLLPALIPFHKMTTESPSLKSIPTQPTQTFGTQLIPGFPPHSKPALLWNPTITKRLIQEVMPGGQAQRIRKGAKSCTECKWRQSHDITNLSLVFLIPKAGRRRKVRCIQSFGDAQTCRRCEERGSECIAQTHHSGSTTTQKSSSRHRITQLESKVLSLTETVREIQLKLKSQTTQSAESSVG